MPDLAAGQRYAELEVAGADLSGSRLEGASFLHCTFRSIEADVARWRGVSARKVTFGSSRMTGIHLNEAELSVVRFERCRLARASFRDASCRSTDLRGSSLDDLDGAGGLAGATIDAVQLMELAPALARHIGLRVDAG
jgi:uncharacterized protein YjbI with pentapeptide repeats